MLIDDWWPLDSFELVTRKIKAWLESWNFSFRVVVEGQGLEIEFNHQELMICFYFHFYLFIWLHPALSCAHRIFSLIPAGI